MNKKERLMLVQIEHGLPLGYVFEPAKDGHKIIKLRTKEVVFKSTKLSEILDKTYELQRGGPSL